MNNAQFSIRAKQASYEGQMAKKGRIMDADFAAETANLARFQILQQAGMAMVAQANAIRRTFWPCSVNRSSVNPDERCGGTQFLRTFSVGTTLEMVMNIDSIQAANAPQRTGSPMPQYRPAGRKGLQLRAAAKQSVQADPQAKF